MFDGDVYLAKSETGHYKIGISKDPYARVKHFDTIMPIDVDIVHSFPSDNCREAERLLHEQYAAYRHKGEWFNLPDYAIRHIKEITTYFEGEFCWPMDEANQAIHDLFAAGRIAWTEAELPY